ncbi:MAG: hypothetical protein HY319_19415 [Armatimonadetes bacterium]|nr:hypothetical protein [Armatimonadota bacterium]
MGLALLLTGLAFCHAQTPAEFTPPGPNVALHKPYTLEPTPNYVDCTDDPIRTVLTDGEYTKGYFWVQKSTVGWVNTRPVAISIDLGKVEPIAGLTFSTAAGVAGVVWPGSLWIMVSDDGKQWTVAGNLLALSDKRGAPAPTPYSLHRYVTGDLQTRGRYVALVVDQVPYTVVDEVEVYRGQPAWLSVAPKGRQTAESPLEYWRGRQVIELIQGRMRTDLDEIAGGIETAKLNEAEKATLRTRAEALRGEIEALEDVPENFSTTVLPLTDLHARVYALQAPLLRARGLKGLTVWETYRYDMLQPLQAPASPLAKKPSGLSVRMMRNERRAEVLNLTNATEAPMAVTLKATGAGRSAAYLSLRAVIYTDTRQRTPVAAALAAPEPAERGLRAMIPAGTTRQVWLDFSSQKLTAGGYRAALRISAAGCEAVTVPISLHVASPTMPAEFSIAIGGWDETNNKGSYDVTSENMMPLIRNLRAHGVNMPWSNPQVMPTPGNYDAEGNMTVPPDFTAWDEWVARWQGAQYWGLFPNVKSAFANEPMGTPRFNKMVGAWVTAWAQHAQAQGIKPRQIMILLVDEPSRDEQDQIIIAWAKAIHAAQPEMVIWNDPVHPEPEKALPEFYTTSDVLSPNTSRFLSGGQPYQDFLVAQQQAGRELWFYSCSGPAKLLDPASYWRGQFWLNLKYGGKGSCYWAFGDEAGNSWNAYVQPRASYSPLFLSKTTVTDAKQMEAIREGAEDYETFVMLRARVAELEQKGVHSPLVTEARTLLTTGPAQAVAIMGADKQQWTVPKDRQVMDRVRLQALDLLEKLSRR